MTPIERHTRNEPGTRAHPGTTLSVMNDAWFELISAAVDDELSADESDLLERHRAQTPRAGELQDELVALRRRTLIEPTVTIPDLADDIVARSRRDPESPIAESPIAEGHTRSGWGRWVAGTGIAAAAASLVAIVTVVAGPWPSGESGDDPLSEPATVVASDSSFDDTDLHVPTGAAITWVNGGTTTHELVQQLPDASVRGVLRPDEDRSVTFEEPGVYEFYCDIHDNMSGTVTVDGD